jgi:hypothetical protein
MPARVTDEQKEWIVRCDARGVPAEQLIKELVDAGVTKAAAKKAVDAVLAHPAARVARELSERTQRLEWHASVKRQLAALNPDSQLVPRLMRPTASELLAKFYSQHRPVVITGVVTGWPAYARWSVPYLKSRFGDVEVQVTTERAGQPHYESNSGKSVSAMKFSEFIDWVETAGQSNDRYLVANNDALRSGRLSGLLDDVPMDSGLLDPKRTSGFAYLWYGPAGTVTPLHHDTTNILFCQVRGKKRVKLVSPLHTELLEHAVGYYARADLDDPDAAKYPELASLKPLTVELAAGEALLIPAGWWHHVRALTTSISVSLTNFVFPNDFEDDNPYAD